VARPAPSPEAIRLRFPKSEGWAMLVIVLENAPPRLRVGWRCGFSRFGLASMSGPFEEGAGDDLEPGRGRDRKRKRRHGLDSEQRVRLRSRHGGDNRRIPVEMDGLKFVSFCPAADNVEGEP